MDAEVVCQEYASSLDDLTFNSKPLINMLTMLAEENVQHAGEIIKLIERRIYEVAIDKKLPSLYLMDSIVKNIGKEYITAVTPCIVALFSHVFEKADEKIRMSLYKLRNTWPPYFSPKKLHEIDCSVHRLDPGWPVISPPPPSPSIHINPKFLPKVEENVEEPKTSSSSSDEAKILEEFEKKKLELEKLQGEQIRLQQQQLEELRLKNDLIKKKQEQERQELIKQQQQQILQMRLQQENIDTSEMKPDATKTSGTTTQTNQITRDPRLEKLERNFTDKTKTTPSEEQTNTKFEKTIEKVAPQTTASVETSVQTCVQKVGFDSDFVPLDKGKEETEMPVEIAYNRDRPLGNKRYFKKTSSDSDQIKIMGIETEQNSTNVNDDHKNVRMHESIRENNRRSKKVRDNIVNDGDIVRDSVVFRKGYKQGERKHRRHEQDKGMKGKSASTRGRDRDGRKRGISRRDNDTEKRGRGRNRNKNNEEFSEGIQGTLSRHEDWNRGRGHKRSRRGHGDIGEPRQARHQRGFSATCDINRLPDHPPRNWAPAGDYPFDQDVGGGEPNFKKARPLFSEREISEIRGRRHGSPPPDFPRVLPRDFDPRQNQPVWHHQEPEFESGFHRDWRHGNDTRKEHEEFFDQPFPRGHQDLREPGFSHPDHLRERAPDFHRHPNQFAGGVEIPMELTLDNESEILRSARHRLSTGDLSEEQHHELLEKMQQLEQLYELQKWQRRHSHDLSSLPEAELPFGPPNRHPLHPPSGLPLNAHPPGPEPPAGLQGFPHQPINSIMLGESVPGVFDHQPVSTPETIARTEGPPPQSDGGLLASRDSGPTVEQGLVKDEVAPAPPSNLLMEKQTVDDLFKRLLDFGIITKINEGSGSPGRAMTPPVEPQVVEIPVPEIKLTLEHLRRRYDGVILELYRGTQCSSCGLRFKEADNTNYRQHLDWHFRVNRKEKETIAAHRNWFITVEDWLDFESSEDPKLKARSSVFEADSEDESEPSEIGVEGSCPALLEDTEVEKACDICLEKFETFWDETSEDWHYKSAVRIDGKTYHYLCYQDAKEAEDTDDDVEASDGAESANEDDIVAVETHDQDEAKSDNNETCSNSNKTSIVTESTESIQVGGGGVNDANKEEKKPESL